MKSTALLFCSMHARWYNKKVLTVMLHISCWLLLFSLPFLLRPSTEPRRESPRSDENFIYIIAIKYIFFAGTFYFNAFFVVPGVIYRRKLWMYLLSILSIFAVLSFVDWILFGLLMENHVYSFKNFFSFNLFPILFILAISTAYRMVNDRIKEDRLQKDKITENLKTELSLLRSQVSPHFMFNIMNNMVALARKKSDLLEPSLLKLSSLLRYMLYETDEKVSLLKEIEYLQSYIELQKQRFGNNVIIKSCMEKIDRNYEIEPMLLISFVENAFKHGTGFVSKVPGSDLILYNIPEIDITLTAEKNVLNFSVRNRYTEDLVETKDKTPGIGLNNVKRRLNLLHENAHSLHIEKEEGWFIVSLQIILD